MQVIAKLVSEEEGNVLASELSVHDNESEKGTNSGICPFTVNGVTGEELNTMSVETMKAIALRHLEGLGKVLAIGCGSDPVSMYDNPQSYLQMFPWLFPYGLDRIGQLIHKGVIVEDTQKRKLLLYYDKRFQSDPYFSMVAFNQSQIKSAVTGSFLMAAKSRFGDVVDCLNKINSAVLVDIITQLTKGECVYNL